LNGSGKGLRPLVWEAFFKNLNWVPQLTKINWAIILMGVNLGSLRKTLNTRNWAGIGPKLVGFPTWFLGPGGWVGNLADLVIFPKGIILQKNKGKDFLLEPIFGLGPLGRFQEEVG